MGKYSKLWVALAGTVGVALSEFQVIDTGQANALVTTAISLLAAFGVYQVPNTPPPPTAKR